MFMGTATTGYSVSFFAPTILKQLGWTSIKAQVMLIPMWIVAFIFNVSTSLLSDLLRHRFSFAFGGVLLSTIGYGLLLNQRHLSAGVRYAALYFLGAGNFTTQPTVMTWLINNVGGQYKRGIASAFQIGLGNISGLIASNIYLPQQAPEYPVGYGVGLGMVWLCGLSCLIFLGLLIDENRKRARGERDHVLSLPEEELANLGDGHPSFRFTY